MIFMVIRVHKSVRSIFCNFDMRSVDIRHGATPIVESLSSSKWPSRIMDYQLFRTLRHLELFFSIRIKCPELLYMIGDDFCDNGNIWSSYTQKKIHFTWMVDTIFENKIFWITKEGSYQSSDKYDKP